MEYFDKETNTTIVEFNKQKIAVIQIIGEIEGHEIISDNYKKTSYNHLLPVISNIEYDKNISGLLFIIHSSGGDVDAGLAISEFISGLSKPTVSLITGTCHSIAIPIAVSCDYSFISESGLMLLHPIRMHGTTIEGKQSFEYISNLQLRITDYICNHSSVNLENFNKMLYNKKELTQDIGSMLNSHDCVSSGLINSIGNIDTAMNKLITLIDIFQNVQLHP